LTVVAGVLNGAKWCGAVLRVQPAQKSRLERQRENTVVEEKATSPSYRWSLKQDRRMKYATATVEKDLEPVTEKTFKNKKVSL
jgi:hypothetical protein